MTPMIPEAHALFATMSRRNHFSGLLERLGAQKIAEVGVYRGDFFAELMSAPSVTQALAVDPWEKLPEENLDMLSPKKRATGWNFEHEFMKKLREDFEAKWARDSRVKVFCGLSVDAAAEVPNGSLDFVYIDAWHDYENAKVDIATWFPKVRSGGVLAGHDYNPRQGVFRAVNEFVQHGRVDRFHYFPGQAGNWMLLVP